MTIRHVMIDQHCSRWPAILIGRVSPDSLPPNIPTVLSVENKKPSSCWDDRIGAKIPFPMGVWSHAALNFKVFNSHANLIMKCYTNELKWIGFIYQFRDSGISSSFSHWCGHPSNLRVFCTLYVMSSMLIDYTNHQVGGACRPIGM